MYHIASYRYTSRNRVSSRRESKMKAHRESLSQPAKREVEVGREYHAGGGLI
jgi:hypothetical protein